jgi:hypothetical protein
MNIREWSDATVFHVGAVSIVVPVMVIVFCVFKCATKPESLCYDMCRPRGVVELREGNCKCSDTVPLQTPLR